MIEHTPGPWKFFKVGVSNDCGVDIQNTQTVYFEREGDARLIAAAPDLLAALEKLLAYSDMDDDDLRLAVARGEAKVAISKARNN